LTNYFELLSNDLKKLWDNLDAPKKALIVLFCAIAIAAVSFIIIKSTEPEWGVLYSDLSEIDSAAIAESLRDSGHPYKVSDNGKTILVPARVKEELRVKVAENNIIKSSNPGFELLDKMQFGATEFQQKLTKQRIYQDELTKTIETIRGIKKARIQIAEPDRSVFADRDEVPTASVMLVLKADANIKLEQIKAIKNMVAYGVPRLTPENVFVSDQNGNPLSDKMDESSSGIDGYRRDFERETAKKVQKVLQRIVGVNNVSVEVSAEINFDRSKKTVEKYLPSGSANSEPTGVLESVREDLETYGKGEKKAGITDENALSTEGENEISSDTSSEKGKNTNYEKTRNSKDYKISKEIEQVVYAPGKVERITIAVALNKILTSEQKEEIKQLVISASGADLTRGDVITITGMEFASSVEELNEPILKQMDAISGLEVVVTQVGPLVVVLVLGLGALFVLNSLLKKPLYGEEVYSSSEDRYNEGYPPGIERDNPDLLETTANMPAITANLDPEIEKMRTELNNTIAADPQEAARLLLSYIKD